VSFASITLCVASQRVFLLLFISLSTQSGNFWIYPRRLTKCFMEVNVRKLNTSQFLRTQCSSVSITKRPRAKRPSFHFQHEQGRDFFFATVSRPAMRSTQPPTQWIPGGLPRGCEVYNLPPSTVEVKNSWSCTSFPHVFMVWYLIKSRNNLSFYLYFMNNNTEVARIKN
jgi:hypothetical protein